MPTINPNTTQHHIGPIMNFSKSQLLAMSESLLLRFAIDFYQLNNPALKALDSIASDLGCTPQVISNHLGGKGSIGVAGMIRLYEVTECELIRDWIEVRMGSFGIGKRGRK